MKSFLYLSSLSFLLLISSCNPCGSVICENNSNCDKKTGDCISNCNHGTNAPKDGRCTCDDFYTGNNCNKHVAEEYADHKYIGSMMINNRVSKDTIILTYQKNTPKYMNFNNGNTTLELTSSFAYNIVGTFEGYDGTYTCDSVTGRFYLNEMEFEGEVTYKYIFWGQKYESTRNISFKGYEHY